MNQKMLTAVAVIIILLIGGGAYWYMSNQPNAIPSGSESTNTDTQQSLKDLIGANRPVKCEFKDDGGAEGTVYVGNGKVRSDFTTTSGGQMMRAHMITDKETSYTWIDGMMTGYKFSMSVDDQNAPVNSGTLQAQFNQNEKLDYRCDTWSVDASLFIMPTGIEFTDLNAMMPTGVNVNTNVNADGSADISAPDCSMCDSAPAEARSQCRAALGC